MSMSRISRRRFVTATAGCASYLAAAGPLLSAPALRRWSGAEARRIVAQTPFARIEELGDGMFAIISTPLNGDYTTVCNGGIIGGSSGTLVVEAFATPEGAAWAAEQARALTGRWPTQVVVSHYHGDHSAGPAGYAEDGESAPQLRATAVTRDLVQGSPGDGAAKARWADVVVVPEDGPVEIDLGSRTVAVVPREGHTASDLSVEVDGGEGPVWCGDLVWNSMFPNYMDAVPSRLSRSVRALQAMGADTFVPGHGPLADAAVMSRYVALIDSVEEAARNAWRRGINSDDAAAAYVVPAELGEWMMFSPNYHQRAIQAWLDELAGAE
ncbi:MAG: MBL fold metallo-hydrolase [Gemmatimonadota bacterium]|nr:MBL fold metallo-hydrolase [Gemmatimonadota bacterium]